MTEPPDHKMADPIKLQSFLDEHLKLILDLRDRVSVVHAGILGLGELEWNQYRKALPPSPGRSSIDFGEKSRHAKDWVLSVALRDLVSIQARFFEQVRQFMEMALVLASDQNEEEKKKAILERVADAPANTKDLIESLEQLLSPRFQSAREIRSLIALNLLFSSRGSGKESIFSSEPLSVHLQLPRFAKPDPSAEKWDYEIQSTEWKFDSPDQVQASPEMVYSIFFTAFAISKNIAEACQFKFSQIHPLPDGFSQPLPNTHP